MRHLNFSPLLPAVLLMLVAGCDETLTLEPQDEVREENAIIDATSARAAQAGMYDALQSNSYYGEGFVTFGDLTADDVFHTGTFTSYALADRYDLRADNDEIEVIWEAIYEAIATNNQVLARVPSVRGLDSARMTGGVWVQVEKNQILGEAHFLRALSYHNLVKSWGDVPLVLEPPPNVDAAGQVTRSPVSAVYAQILADLDKAEDLMTIDQQRRKGSLGAVLALRSRVQLYLRNWSAAEAAAEAVVAMGYELAEEYGDLFTAEGQDTPEDIFRVAFTAQEYTNLPYYYLSGLVGGRREVAPTAAHAAAYEAGDRRRAWSISFDARGRRYGSKYPDAEGAEDLHIIRFAEVLLNKAEAEAQQGKLLEAIDSYNLVRVRAGLAPHVLGVGGIVTQQDVLNAIYKERRFELAMEGFRWPDLVRWGLAPTTLGIPAFRTLFPIPLSELDVAPNLTQNPGY